MSCTVFFDRVLVFDLIRTFTYDISVYVIRKNNVSSLVSN